MQMAGRAGPAGSEAVGRNGRYLPSAASVLPRPNLSHLEAGRAPPTHREEGRAKAAIMALAGAVGSGLGLTVVVRARPIVSRTKGGSVSPRLTHLIKNTASPGR